MGQITDNVRKINDIIFETAQRAGRSFSDIKLIAVSKGFGIEQIKEAIDAGLTNFGENKVQEALPKIQFFNKYPQIKWYMIGHLQTNKTKICVEFFDEIHSVDSIKLLKKLNEQAKKCGKIVPVLLEVNVSGEETKFGVPFEKFESFIEEVNQTNFENVQMQGLMTIAPFSQNPEDSRPYFRKLAFLAKKYNFRHLSMGMSNDFAVAIEEGATIIRIGTAIFGQRF